MSTVISVQVVSSAHLTTPFFHDWLCHLRKSPGLGSVRSGIVLVLRSEAVEIEQALSLKWTVNLTEDWRNSKTDLKKAHTKQNVKIPTAP